MKVTINNVKKVEEEIAQLAGTTPQDLRRESCLWNAPCTGLKRPTEIHRYYHYLCAQRKKLRGLKLTQDLGIQFD